MLCLVRHPMALRLSRGFLASFSSPFNKLVSRTTFTYMRSGYQGFHETKSSAMEGLFTSDTPVRVKSSAALHLLTANTGNGQAVQIFLEELAETYGTTWTTTLINIWSNEQKTDCTSSGNNSHRWASMDVWRTGKANGSNYITHRVPPA